MRLLATLLAIVLLLAGCASGGRPAPTVHSALSAVAHAQALQLIEQARRHESALQWQAALQSANQAIAFIEARAGAADPMLWSPLSVRATALEMTGRIDAAQADLQRMLTVGAAYREPGRTAMAQVGLGRLAAYREDGRRDTAQARRHFEAALNSLAQADGSAGQVTMLVLNQYADFASTVDDLPLWRSLLDRARAQLDRMPQPHKADRAEVLSSQAFYAWRTGDLLQAMELGRQTSVLLDTEAFTGDRRREVLLMRHLALLSSVGLLDEAAARYADLTTRVTPPIENGPGRFDAEAVDLTLAILLAAGQNEAMAGRADAAAAHATRAEAMLARSPYPARPVRQVALWRLQATADELRGRWQPAQAALRRLVALGSRCEAADARLAYALHHLGQAEESARWVATALQNMPARCAEEGAAGYEALARLQAERQQVPLAILLGKLAVEKIGLARQRVEQLDLATQRAFAMGHARTYALLAGWLAEQGRLNESEEVLALLKLREYGLYARSGDSGARVVGFSPTEQAARAALAAPGGQGLDAAQRRLAAATAPARAPQPLAPPAAERPRLEPEDVHVTLWMAADRLHVMVRRLDPRLDLARQAEQPEPAVRSAIFQVRSDLQLLQGAAPGAADEATRSRLQALHALVWQPVQQALDAGPPAQRVLLSVHGALRFVPFAALYDGRQYVVERYALLMLAAVPDGDVARPSAPAPGRLVAFAAPEAAKGFAPLPMAAEEAGTAVRAAGGETAGARQYVGRAFTRDRLFEGVTGFAQVHIASHFRLAPGDDRASFLLLGDGTTATAAELAQRPISRVALWVLAACDTAVPAHTVYGSGQELESFSALLIRRGVGTVVGTLARVDDRASEQLMSALYPIAPDATPRDVAQALRRAQLRLLQTGGQRHAHPAHWAQYVAIAAPPR